MPEHMTVLDVAKAYQDLKRIPLQPINVRLNGEDLIALKRMSLDILNDRAQVVTDYTWPVSGRTQSAFFGVPVQIDNELDHGEYVFEYRGRMPDRIVKKRHG